MSDGSTHESRTPFAYEGPSDAQIMFVMAVENVPAGARISFSSSSTPRSGETIGGEWTVPPGPGGGAINPAFQVGQTVTVNPGYATVITYRTEFSGLPVPAAFRMEMKALRAVMTHSSADGLEDSGDGPGANATS